MSVREVMLTDEQRAMFEPLVPKPPARPKGGRPPSVLGYSPAAQDRSEMKGSPESASASLNMLAVAQAVV
jgi:hypothetical protein